MSYDDFTAKLVTENLALKKQLDSAVEALKEITPYTKEEILTRAIDGETDWYDGWNAAVGKIEAALASIKE